MKVTFLGLGIMGSRMARHLLDHGTDLTVWNRSPEPREELEKAGAKSTDTAAQAVREADLVITMLSTPEVVRTVVLEAGLLGEMKPGAIWADSSTVSPQFARESGKAAEAAGIRYLGVPVAGTREPAESGELKVLVGGPADVLEAARPALEAYSSGIVHVGEDVDHGAAYKILVNSMLAQSMLVFSETLLLGEAMGLDKEFMLKAMPGLPVIAPFVKTKVEHMRQGKYEDASFPLELMHKDLNLIVETAYAVDQPTLLAAVAREVYGRAKRAGRGREDMSAIHGYLEGEGK